MDRKMILRIHSYLMLSYQNRKVMQKQGLLVPFGALNDPCHCSWKVCLERTAMHKVIHSFPLLKEPELALQHIALMGFALT